MYTYNIYLKYTLSTPLIHPSIHSTNQTSNPPSISNFPSDQLLADQKKFVITELDPLSLDRLKLELSRNFGIEMEMEIDLMWVYNVSTRSHTQTHTLFTYLYTHESLHITDGTLTFTFIYSVHTPHSAPNLISSPYRTCICIYLEVASCPSRGNIWK